MKQKENKAIRNQYQKMGVEEYYTHFGDQYINPHFEFIQEVLIHNKNRIDYSLALDLCCGSGEVTQVLSDLGFSDTVACDPFTQEAFFKNHSKKCLPFHFDDIIRGALSDMPPFTSIICSFAMHLCPHDKLYPLVSQLFRITPQLIIITPHKRPELEQFSGIQLDFVDDVLTERGKKVRLKSYSSSYKL